MRNNTLALSARSILSLASSSSGGYHGWPRQSSSLSDVDFSQQLRCRCFIYMYIFLLFFTLNFFIIYTCIFIYFFISSITIIARIESHLVHTKAAPAIRRPIRYIMFGHLPTGYCVSNNHVPPIKQMMTSIRTTSVTFAHTRMYLYRLIIIIIFHFHPQHNTNAH